MVLPRPDQEFMDIIIGGLLGGAIVEGAKGGYRIIFTQGA